jgi:hypothetical protein
MEAVAGRLDQLSSALLGEGEVHPADDPAIATTGGDASVAEQQMRRMERQVGVLERAAAATMTTGSKTRARETLPVT